MVPNLSWWTAFGYKLWKPNSEFKNTYNSVSDVDLAIVVFNLDQQIIGLELLVSS